MKRIVVLWLALTLCAGCDKKSDTAAEPKGSGVQACDDYVAALEACIAKLPEAERGPMEEQLRNQKNALKKAKLQQKKQMRDSCRTGTATLNADPRCK